MRNDITMQSDPMVGEGARKKAKIVEVEAFAAEAFDLFRCHLDSLDDGENENDTDGESTEYMSQLVNLMQSRVIQPFQGPLSSIQKLSDMLGILASVVYFQCASTAVARYLSGEKSKEPQEAINECLHFFPHNAACLSMAANFGRITETLSKDTVTQWYQEAAQHSRRIRRETLALLESDHIDDSIKEWMELLLLQQVVGVEYVAQDDGSARGEQEDSGHFSASSVEATSRFMAAVLLSRDGHHSQALQHLKLFSLVTHRLHPNVWLGEGSCVSNTRTASFAPLSFRNVLPPKLYQRMCTTFGPNANYWNESDYVNQGYYSFLVDFDDQKIKNLIDEVIIRHLLPCARHVLGDKADEICAYEWWVHSRQASLGHTLHFDTDKASLERGEAVHHPLLSSVLYLAGDETSGATILLDQTPESDTAKRCWRSVPYPNTFMVFPGNLLHGVLPCRSPGVADSQAPSTNGSANQARESWINPPDDILPKRRLTFMVGFKTRSVPDQRRGESLYGPCAPLPSSLTEEWVREIQSGYNDDSNTNEMESQMDEIAMKELPCVSPAWECIPKDDSGISDNDPHLELPDGINQRFFVSGEPSQCFRDSLFEHDEVPQF